MTATALRTKSETPPVFPSRPPERAALATAIARKAAAEKRQADIGAALKRSNSSNLFHAVKQAKAALAEAEASEGSFLAACAINQTGSDASPSKVAAARLAQLEADYSQAKRTQAALETASEAAERELDWAKRELDAALRDAVQSDVAVEKLIAHYRSKQSEYFNACGTLYALSRAGCGVLSSFGQGFNPSFERHAEPEAALRWIELLERLKSDPDATLPSS